MSPGIENKILTKEYFFLGGEGGKKIRKWKKLSENTYFRYESSAMVYTISQNHPECFFLALYHMSPGVENNILAKKYLREGQKICKLKEFI